MGPVRPKFCFPCGTGCQERTQSASLRTPASNPYPSRTTSDCRGPGLPSGPGGTKQKRCRLGQKDKMARARRDREPRLPASAATGGGGGKEGGTGSTLSQFHIQSHRVPPSNVWEKRLRLKRSDHRARSRARREGQAAGRALGGQVGVEACASPCTWPCTSVCGPGKLARQRPACPALPRTSERRGAVAGSGRSAWRTDTPPPQRPSGDEHLSLGSKTARTGAGGEGAERIHGLGSRVWRGQGIHRGPRRRPGTPSALPSLTTPPSTVENHAGLCGESFSGRPSASPSPVATAEGSAPVTPDT